MTLCLSLILPLCGICQGEELNFHRISFADPNNGIALGSTDEGYVVLLSHDGGKTWNVAYEMRSVFKAISWENRLSGWVVGRGGLLLSTNDGGNSWHENSTGIIEDINKIAHGPHGSLFILANNGLLLTSTDLGRSWRQQRLDGGRDLLDIAVLPSGRIVLLGRNRMFVSDNDGTTWQKLSEPIRETWSIIGFFDDKCGLISGGALARTLDGGKTITWVNLHTNDWVGALTIVSANTAFLVTGQAETGSTIRRAGDMLPSHSTILETEDRGSNWKQVFHLADAETHAAFLEDLFWYNRQFGWAVGDLGLMTMTKDGGKTWSVCRITSTYDQPAARPTSGLRQWQTICGAPQSFR